MRQFIVVGHEAPASGEFSLDDLPGAGRLDVLCRCITNSLLLSHDIRDAVRIHLVVNDEYVVWFDGSELRRLNPDERSTGALLRGALRDRDQAIGEQPVSTAPGIYIAQKTFRSLIEQCADDGRLVALQLDGQPVVECDLSPDPIFVLSDHRPFTTHETTILNDHVDHRISLGPLPLHADQAITVAHNYLDTHGYTHY